MVASPARMIGRRNPSLLRWTKVVALCTVFASPRAQAQSNVDPTLAPKLERKPSAFSGTQVFAMTSMSTATVFPNQQQDYNPTIDTSLFFQPRYALSDALQLRGRLVFTYELTNSDTTVTRNEPRLSDTLAQLYYRKIPEVAGIKPLVGVSLALPTSPESRARTMLFSPGVVAQASKSFAHVWGGGVSLLAVAAYAHPIYGRQTAEIRGRAPYAFACAGGTSCQDQLSGVFNPSDIVSYSLIVSGHWGRWSPALMYLGTSQWVYQGKTPVNPIDGTPVVSPSGFEPTIIRQTSYVSAWLDYDVNSWLTAEIGYAMLRNVLDEDGTRGNPFISRYQDMRVYLGANINVENAVLEISGGSGERGVVRATNAFATPRAF